MSTLSFLINLRQASKFFLALPDGRAAHELGNVLAVQSVSYTTFQSLISSGLRVRYFRPCLAGNRVCFSLGFQSSPCVWLGKQWYHSCSLYFLLLPDGNQELLGKFPQIHHESLDNKGATIGFTSWWSARPTSPPSETVIVVPCSMPCLKAVVTPFMYFVLDTDRHWTWTLM